MSDHFNSFLMNDVLIRLEKQSFFADIGEERTLSFVQEALALSRYHDGNPGEALAGVGQRLGICYYCWERGDDLRQGICRECRAADAIAIEPEDAEESPPRKTSLGYAFMREDTVRDLLEFLPEQRTHDLDSRTLHQVPGACIGTDLREIRVDSAWSVDYLPGRRRRLGTPVLMIELLAHPYPRVVQRLRHYAATLSESLCHSGSVEEEPPFIVAVLLYNGFPAWTPRSLSKGWNRFDYTFIDVGRMRSDGEEIRRLAEVFFGFQHRRSPVVIRRPDSGEVHGSDRASGRCTLGGVLAEQFPVCTRGLEERPVQTGG